MQNSKTQQLISEQEDWPIFICYRQADGRAIAELLYRALNNAILPFIPKGYPAPPPTSVYFDQTAPAVSDWTMIHAPALERARTFIVVCSPGAYSRLGDDDWVYRELDWWLEHQDTAPILVTSHGQRWIPKELQKRWPNAQRLDMPFERVPAPSDPAYEELRHQLQFRILEGLRQSSVQVLYEAVEREKARTKKLTEQRRILAIVSVVAAALGLAAGAFYMQSRSNESRAETQRKAAVRATREANRQLAEANWLVAEGATGSALGSDDLSPIKATHYLLRSAAASQAAGEPIAARNASLAAHFNSADLLFTTVHDGPIYGAYTSPDGSRILTCGRDGKACLWNADNGTAVTSPMQHPTAILGARFSRDGQWILTWGWDKSIRVWRSRDGSLFQSVTNDYSTKGAIFSPNAEQLLCWSEMTAFVWWRASGTNHGTRIPHGYGLLGADLSSNGQRVVTWGENGNVQLWDARDGKALGAVCVKSRQNPWHYVVPSSSAGRRFLGRLPRAVGLCQCSGGNWSSTDKKLPRSPPKRGLITLRSARLRGGLAMRTTVSAVRTSDPTIQQRPPMPKHGRPRWFARCGAGKTVAISTPHA